MRQIRLYITSQKKVRMHQFKRHKKQTDLINEEPYTTIKFADEQFFVLKKGEY